MKYRDKTLDASAIQFNGLGDIPAVIEALGGKPVQVLTSPALTVTFGESAVQVGDYVATRFDGKVEVVPAVDFVARFEAVDVAPVALDPQAGA